MNLFIIIVIVVILIWLILVFISSLNFGTNTVPQVTINKWVEEGKLLRKKEEDRKNNEWIKEKTKEFILAKKIFFNSTYTPLVVYSCKNCGANIDKDKIIDDTYTCNYCRTTYKIQ